MRELRRRLSKDTLSADAVAQGVKFCRNLLTVADRLVKQDAGLSGNAATVGLSAAEYCRRVGENTVEAAVKLAHLEREAAAYQSGFSPLQAGVSASAEHDQDGRTVLRVQVEPPPAS